MTSLLPRPFAEVYALAGFMTEANVRTFIPTFDALPEVTRTAVQERLGTSTRCSSLPTSGKPRFHHIEERDVLNLLFELGGAAPAGLENLIGFAWVEIRDILAGHFVTKPIRTEANLPSNPTALQLARYCMFSFGESIQGRVLPGPIMVSGTAFNFAFSRAELVGSQLAVVYDISPVFSPVHLLIVYDQVIAIRGLEKLAYLVEIGIEHALCLISYGFGTSALPFLPVVPKELLESTRPPMVLDLLDTSLSVRVPVALPISMATIKSESLHLNDA